MKAAELRRPKHFCSSGHSLRNDGIFYERLLGNARVPSTSLTYFLQQSRVLPFGVNGYVSLRECSVSDFKKDRHWLELKSPMPRANAGKPKNNTITVPNFAWNIDERCIRAFLVANDEEIMADLAEKLNDHSLLKIPFRKFTRMLEAVLPASGFPPLHIAIVNFVIPIGQPRKILLKRKYEKRG